MAKTKSGLPPAARTSAKNVAGSGLVMGIAGGLLAWLAGYVGPVLFIPVTIVAGVLGAIIFGVPAFIFERRVARERKEEEARISARKAAAAAAARRAAESAPAAQPQVVVVHVPGPQAPAYPSAPPAYRSPSGGASSWAPIPSAAGAAGSSGSSFMPETQGPVEVSGDHVPSWPRDEPLCYMETSREKDVWDVVRQAQVKAEDFIGFTTAPCESVASDLGLPVGRFTKISRIEAEDSMDPGNLERIVNHIERHLDGGSGRLVVLPSVENLVEAGNVRNVRRCLEVLRDLAQGSHGSILITLDPVSLPPASVTLLERGAHHLE